MPTYTRSKATGFVRPRHLLVRCCLVAHCSDFWVFYFHNNVLQLLTLNDDWTLKSVYIHLLVQNHLILECLLEYMIYILLTHVLLYNR